MKCLTYKESLSKIIEAEKVHLEAIDVTKATTIKFLASKENFVNNNEKNTKDFLSKIMQQQEELGGTIKSIEFFASNSILSPLGLDQVCTFLSQIFLPRLDQIRNRYEEGFQEALKFIQKNIDVLSESETKYNEAKETQDKLCKDIEELNKNHASKKLDDKFNSDCFEFKNVQEKTLNALKDLNDADFNFHCSFDRFLSGFELIDRERAEHLQNLFLSLSDTLQEVLGKKNEIAQQILDATNHLDPRDDVEKSFSLEELTSESKVPQQPEDVNLSFNISEYLDNQKLFEDKMKQTYAIAKEEIKGEDGSIIVPKDQRVFIISSDNDSKKVIVTNYNNSIQTKVSKDILDIKDGFNRYLAKVTKGALEGQVVLVTYKNELCECITAYNTIEFIDQNDLEPISN